MREINVNELKKLQSEGKKLLVDFKANWCSPCKTLLPMLDGISNDYDNVEFVSVDVDDNMDHIMELEIRSVPTVIIYDGEKVVDRSKGIQKESYYKEILDTL